MWQLHDMDDNCVIVNQSIVGIWPNSAIWVRSCPFGSCRSSGHLPKWNIGAELKTANSKDSPIFTITVLWPLHECTRYSIYLQKIYWPNHWFEKGRHFLFSNFAYSESRLTWEIWKFILCFGAMNPDRGTQISDISPIWKSNLAQFLIEK